jgi:predicted ATP-grasp superfamily ATP-dependent carboligase
VTKKAFKSGIGRLKAIPVMNKSELSKQYERVRNIDNKLIVQKMIVGPDENHLCYHALIDSEGRIIAEFVGKKLRLTPPHFGMGCYVEAIKSDEVINEGRRILRLLNYRGMAEIDFKRDERDGKLYFFELNPRFGFWMGLDSACGVDFPFYYYKTCLGEQIVADKNYLVGKKWLSLYHDIKGLRVNLKDSSLTWYKWIISVIKNDVGAIFALDDPMPAVKLFQNVMKSQARKVVKKIKN